MLLLRWNSLKPGALAQQSTSLDLSVPQQGQEVGARERHGSASLAAAAVVVAACCWGFIGIAYALILDEFDVSPLTIVSIRSASAAIIVLIVILLRRELRSQVLSLRSRQVLRPLLGAGLISGTGFYIALIYTFDAAGVAVGTVLLYLAPSLVAFGAWKIFGDRLSRLQRIALLTSLVGVIGVSGIITGGDVFRPQGIVLGLASAIAYASYSLFGQVLLARLHPLVVVGMSSLIGAAGIWIIKLIVEGPGMPSLEAAAMIIAVTGIGTTLIPLVLYTWGLARLGAARASLLTTVEPAVAVLLAYVILSETLTPWQWAGGGLVILSVFIAGLERAVR